VAHTPGLSIPPCAYFTHFSRENAPSSNDFDFKVLISVAEPHHFDAAPAPGKNFDAALAPTLLYSKAKNFKTN
jgi:hypothetical protein